MGRSAQAIMRSYVMFKPHAVFLTLAALFFLGAAIPFGRFLVLTWMGTAGDHIQSLVLGSSLLVGSLLCLALLVISDMLRTNRTLLEDSLERIKLVQYSSDRLLDPNADSRADAATHPSLPVSVLAAERRAAVGEDGASRGSADEPEVA
jgi:hypothetical protein